MGMQLGPSICYIWPHFFSEQLSPDIKFLLTNVVYFHDSWVGGSFERLDEDFDPIPDFRLSNGERSGGKPKWMQRSSSHFVLRNITFGGRLHFKAVSIPYEVSILARSKIGKLGFF